MYWPSSVLTLLSKKLKSTRFMRSLERFTVAGLPSRDRLDIAPLQAALTAIGKSLDKIEKTFAARQTGLREIHDIQIVSQLAKILAVNPEIGSQQRADDLIASFQRDAARIGDACRIAAIDFGWADGKAGRPKLQWYDDFTALLLKIARRGGVKPRFGKDQVVATAITSIS
jgi:hypothetical protein